MKTNKGHQTIVIYIFSIISSLISIGLNFFLARTLGAHEYGGLQYFLSLILTTTSFLVFGMVPYLMRESGNENNKNVLNRCISYYSIICLFALPIMYFIFKNDNNLQDSLSIWMIIIASIFYGLVLLFGGYFTGIGKHDISVNIDSLIPKTILFLTSVVFILIYRVSFFNGLFLIIHTFIYFVIGTFLLLRHFRKIDLKTNRQEFISISFFFGTTITNTLTSNLTKVLQVSLFENSVVLAIISISLSIVAVANIFTSVISSIANPIFAKLKRDNENNSVINLLRFITRCNSYICVPLFLFFALHANRFLSLFGSEYTIYPYIFVILSLKTLFTSILGSNGTLLSMTKKENLELINGILHLLSFLILCFVFSFDPIYGLCLSLSISDILISIIKFIEVWFIYKRPPLDIKTIVKILLVIVSNILLIWATKFIFNNILWFILSGLLGIACIVLNFIIPIYKADFKTLIHLNRSKNEKGN